MKYSIVYILPHILGFLFLFINYKYMVRPLLVLLGILFMSSTALGLNTDFLGIEVNVDEEGNARVIERYVLGFAHGFERNEFLRDADKYGGDLLLWGSDPDFNFFFPHFVKGNKYGTTTSIAFIEQTNSLLLEYQTKDIVIAKEEGSRSITWSINDSAFDSFFEDTGSIKIPSNARLEFILPLSSEIQMESIPAGVEINGNRIVLTGISVNFDSLEYRVIKPIAPRLSAIDIFTSPDMVMVVAVLGVIAVLLFVKRKDISTRIEDYVVANSSIEVEEESDEMDLNI